MIVITDLLYCLEHLMAHDGRVITKVPEEATNRVALVMPNSESAIFHSKIYHYFRKINK